MANTEWNKSVAKRETEPTNKRPSAVRGLVAGIIVIAISAIAVWFVVSSGKKGAEEKDNGAKPQLIKEVQPATRAVTNEEEKVDKNSLEWLKKHDSRYIVPDGAYRAPNGRLYAPNGRRILESLPARKIYANNGRKKIFQHSAEREIARLLVLEPGQFFVGNSNYGPRFLESFKKSLSEPTLVTQDDTEDEKALKRQVNEVKADLKARMDAGEDIAQVMKDAEKELRDLAAYKKNMTAELNKIRLGEDVSDSDFQDYIDAANKMLKERGLKELKFPAIHESKLKYARERYRATQAEKALKAEQKAQEKQGGQNEH